MEKKFFKPAWWLPSAHLQTLWPTLCRRSIKLPKLTRERLELPDGDFVDLDWTSEVKGPIVLVLHGLEGSVHSPYAKGILNAIHSRGWRGVLMHFRGCSGEINLHIRSYHSGETDDLSHVIEVLQRREPKVAFAAIGYSLGGNVLLKWLGETGVNNPLRAAVGVSVPFELHKTAERVRHGFARLYQWHFLRSLRKKMTRKFQRRVMTNLPTSFKSLKTMRDFDDKVTAPLHGFRSADDYYHQSSSRQFLSKIATPTLVIQAKDDPLMPLDLLPNPQELSKQVILELTEKGGHVGFVSGKVPWRANYWLEQRIPEFLTHYLSE